VKVNNQGEREANKRESVETKTGRTRSSRQGGVPVRLLYSWGGKKRQNGGGGIATGQLATGGGGLL